MGECAVIETDHIDADVNLDIPEMEEFALVSIKQIG